MMQKLLNSILFTCVFLTTFLGIHMTGNAQSIDPIGDMEFINSNSRIKPHFHKREYIYKEEKSAFKKYNPVSLTLGGLLYLYQNAISQQFSAGCLYEPTCSDYSKQSIVEYGIFKGIFLTSDRLTRCNKIAGLDIHPLTINENTNRAKDPVKHYK